jgi:hypothetical protein
MKASSTSEAERRVGLSDPGNKIPCKTTILNIELNIKRVQDGILPYILSTRNISQCLNYALVLENLSQCWQIIQSIN